MLKESEELSFLGIPEEDDDDSTEEDVGVDTGRASSSLMSI